MGKDYKADPSKYSNAGVVGDALAVYESAALERLAKQAGYETPEEQMEFRKHLDLAIVFYRVFESEPSRAELIAQLKPVREMAAALYAALGNLDFRARQMLNNDISFTERLSVKTVAAATLTLDISAATILNELAQAPAVRKKRGPNIIKFAEGMAIFYGRGDLNFPLGKRERLKGVGRMYHSEAREWLAEILRPVIPDISEHEIDAAAAHCRAICNNIQENLSDPDFRRDVLGELGE